MCAAVIGQQEFTLILIATYLVVAPLVLALAAFAGYRHRASRSAEGSAPPHHGQTHGRAETAAGLPGTGTAYSMPRAAETGPDRGPHQLTPAA
jgi:hypothetical protein